MDHVTAFGLAAGVLQVTSTGFNVLAKCRELWANGALSQHRDTEDVASRLSQAVENLRVSSSQTPSPSLDHDRQLLDVSNRCTETADELLNELGKLKLKQGEAWRKSCKKVFCSIFTTRKLDSLGAKLDGYQKLLNTGILTRLNAQDILQSQNLASISLDVRNLAAGLDQGHRTVAALLPALEHSFQEHVKRNFVLHEQKGEVTKQWEDFKNSLFFPEMFSRHIEIVEPHHETCHWISSEPNEAFSGLGKAGTSSITQWQEGSSFANWLENGGDVYWLSGKPGSGKSTLMKYLSDHFECSQRLTRWANGSDVLVISFFFWALGTQEQRNYAGFLRSSLYQIAHAQRDLIPFLMEKQDVSCGPLQAWTVARLEATLRHFLLHKSTSASLCFIIDGLDEFSGDYLDNLLEIIHLLTQTSQTRVCVSSRPDQIFKDRFSRSPQLQLQDLNLQDILKTAKAELQPMLSEGFPEGGLGTARLIESIAYQAQGVFLWAKIMIQDLKSGIRDANTLKELQLRLCRMPETIDGMYGHMLSKLDESYQNDARRYFRMIKRNPVGLTLLHFIFAEDPAWYASSIERPEDLKSREFEDACNRLEKRISSRCAGLVEVAKDRREYTGWGFAQEHRYATRTRHEIYHCLEIDQQNENVSRHWRDVQFIHRTVGEFLSAHLKTSRESDQTLSISLAEARGRLGVMSLLPSMTCWDFAPEANSARAIAIVYEVLEGTPHLECLQTDEQPSHIPTDDWNHLLNETYEMLCRMYRTSSVAGGPVLDSLTLSGEWPPFHDSVGFAAFFGCHYYVAMEATCDESDLPNSLYLSTCAILGMDYLTSITGFFVSSEIKVSIFLGIQKILRDILPLQEDIDSGSRDQILPRFRGEESTWAIFLRASIQLILVGSSEIMRFRYGTGILFEWAPKVSTRMIENWAALAVVFLASGANINIPLYIGVRHWIDEDIHREIDFVFESTALATIRTMHLGENPCVQSLTKELISFGAIDDYSIYSIERRSDRTQHLLTTDQSTYAKCHPPKGHSIVELPLRRMKVTDTKAREPDSATDSIFSQLINESQGDFRGSIQKLRENWRGRMTNSTTPSFSHGPGS